MLLAAVLSFSPEPRATSVAFDASTHVPYASKGCGANNNPYTPGKSVTATGTYAGVTWTYRVYLPKSYTGTEPLPLIIQRRAHSLRVDPQRQQQPSASSRASKLAAALAKASASAAAAG